MQVELIVGWGIDMQSGEYDEQAPQTLEEEMKYLVRIETSLCKKYGQSSGTIFKSIINAIDERNKDLCMSIDDFKIDK